MTPTIKDTDDLTLEKLAEKNPRIMKAQKDAALGGSMDRWGDLGVFVWNRPTSRLITAHQRMRKLKEKYGSKVKIYIETEYPEPDEYGTVAIGYVGVEGTHVRFAYREVVFSEADEYAAGLASNNATGENDDTMLAEIDFELSQLDNGEELLSLTGQTDKEIEKLLQSVGAGPDLEQPDGSQEEKSSDKLTFALAKDQRPIIDQALALAKQINSIPHTNLDNINGTALYYICRSYVETYEAQVDQPEPGTEPSDQTISTGQMAATPASAAVTTQTPVYDQSIQASTTDLTSIPAA
jgi:hypothetical protein